MSIVSDKSQTELTSAPSSPVEQNDSLGNSSALEVWKPNSVENATLLPIEQYRIQLYNYAIQAERLRLSQQYGTPYANYQTSNGNQIMNYFHPRFQISNEEPKPQHSYIGLIAMGILSSPDMKLVLSDIYQYILDNYTYFRTRGPGWRNSIRHNLSLNDCFIKAGRSANGKGHYWSIHPANVEDFKKGDFRRRKAQRKVRRHMGLAVDDDNDSNSPPPLSPPLTFPNLLFSSHPFQCFPQMLPSIIGSTNTTTTSPCISRKRQFDVDSLLAPDHPTSDKDEAMKKLKTNNFHTSSPQLKMKHVASITDDTYDTRQHGENDRNKSDEELEAEHETDIDVVNNNNDSENEKLQENMILQRYYQTIALRRFQMYQQHLNQSPSDH
uniref:Fork head domain-containing protein FD5 n=1 Tax=Cacopsylla melanoneura TaxID=428564 RepID=A0A8D8ZBM1_9HEMI